MGCVEDDLRATVNGAASRLLAFGEPAVSRAPAPGAWCAKQVIGHLIDSAANNHQRFVRAQFTDDLVFTGYDQERWVEVQGYRQAPWPEVVALWRSYNLHLARVIAAIPRAVREARRTRHNLHELAWRAVAETEPVTLEYFLRDYVGHLEHHLTQVWRTLDTVEGARTGRSPAS